MNAKRLIPSFRLSIRACIMWIALSACTQLNLTTNTPLIPTPTMVIPSTLTPSAVVSVTATAAPTLIATIKPSALPSESPTINPTATRAASPTPSNTPTITPTPAPTWTAWAVDMYFQSGSIIVFSLDNPAQACMRVYFDVTSEPGHLGVNRRDNGGYFACVATVEANQ